MLNISCIVFQTSYRPGIINHFFVVFIFIFSQLHTLLRLKNGVILQNMLDFSVQDIFIEC